MTTTSWTNVTNSFADGTTSTAESATYVQGGAFSASEIKQEVALAESYKSGTAVLTFQRSNVIASDAGAVVLEVLSGGGAVLATGISPPEEKNEFASTYTLRGGTGAWDSGCSSVQTFAGDGYAEHTSLELTTARMFGLSTSDGNANYTSIGYALSCKTDGTLEVWESGASKGAAGSYAAGDVLRVSRIAAVITYLKNGVVIYTSLTASTGALLIDVSLFTANATIKNPKLYDRGNPVAITWQNVVGVAGYNAYTTLAVWAQKRIALDVPAGASTLRVRLLADRALAFGNSGAAFDDFDLQVHKHMEPVSSVVLDFSTVPIQSHIVTWQDFHLAYPALGIIPATVISQLDTDALSFSTVAALGSSIAWSDATTHTAGKCVGSWGDSVASVPCLTFARAASGSAIDVQVTGGSVQRGSFTSTGSFSVRVVFRVVEDSFSVACGLVGRRDGTGVGWGLGLTAAGNVVATLQGASGTKTATSARPVTDGAVHCAWIVYNATAATLRCYVDRRGYIETSTAAGMGEFSVTSAALRIGRDGPASQTLPGQIVSAALFSGVAFTQAQVESTWTYGKDPTGLITGTNRATYRASGTTEVALAGYVDGALDAGGNATLVCHAWDQIPVGYHADSVTTGVAIGAALTNLVTSWSLAIDTAGWKLDGADLIASEADNDTWDSIAKSTVLIAADGYAEFTVRESNTDRAFGLAVTPPAATPYSSITGYAWVLTDYGVAEIREGAAAGTVLERVPYNNGAGYTLSKTAGGYGWNAGISSMATLVGNGYLQFTATETDSYRVIGLSTVDNDITDATIDWGIYLVANGTAQSLENGVGILGFGAYVTGETFRIARVGSTITYYRRAPGATTFTYVGTSAATSSAPLVVDTSFFGGVGPNDGTVSNLVLVGDECPSHITWQTAVGCAVTQAAPTQDTFRITRTGTTVTYRKNGVLIYTSAVSSTGSLVAYATLFTSSIAAQMPARQLLTSQLLFSSNEDIRSVARDMYFGTASAVRDVVVAPLSVPAQLNSSSGSAYFTTDNVAVTNGVVRTFDLADVTGLPRGAVFGLTDAKGVRFTGMPANTIAKVPVTFYAKGSGALLVRLLNASGGVIDQQEVALVTGATLTVPAFLIGNPIDTTIWHRYDVMFDGWDGSSSTFSVEWLAAADTSVSLSFSHVVCVNQETTVTYSQFAAMIPGRTGGGGVHAGEHYAVTAALTEQYSAEGEIDVQGVALTAAGPGARAAIVSVTNDADARHRKDVCSNAAPELLIYLPDTTLGSTNLATAIDWTDLYRLRARWNLAGMIAPETGYGGLRVDGNVDSNVYSQVASWTRNATTLPNVIRIGSSAAALTRLAGYVSRLTVRTTPKRI